MKHDLKNKLKNGDDPKTEDNLKNYDNLKKHDDHKNKDKLKIRTPSRKLWHTAEASLTVFPSERGGTKTPYFNVL